MSRDYNYIRDLNKDSDIWKIGFRLLESWTVVGSNGNQHVKLIIGDAKGDRIHVITRFRDFELWKSLIEESKTLNCYKTILLPSQSWCQNF
ncbi:hypothetical protein MtrunA17_Chr7g0219411 [Medicago truncatula]|uniref:Replication protein A 70 kDa DNA-binding subunit B/D first OB fold domain-containing protein n=1 Tax=Medicago truncatula TaxID=3880 RepID=A0A396GY94_MEDTR|nr:hypothetical protein MtrunA17_Chr7g0219411 [Medicago truncatula]